MSTEAAPEVVVQKIKHRYRFNRRFNLKRHDAKVFMRGDENATYEWKAPKNGGALWVIKLIYEPNNVLATKNIRRAEKVIKNSQH